MSVRWTNPNVKMFLHEVRTALRENRVTLHWSRGGYCVCPEDGEPCEGFFIKPTRKRWGKIRIATGGVSNTEILHTLAHEYAHFLYWLEGDPFGNASVYKDESYTERRALRIMESRGLPICPTRAQALSAAYLKMLRDDEQ
jgi:hypothetical protein